MANKPAPAPLVKQPKSAWIILQCLAAITILGLPASLTHGLFAGTFTATLAFYLSPPILMPALALALLAACLLALLKKTIAPGLIRVAALWALLVALASLPFFSHRLYAWIRDIPPDIYSYQFSFELLPWFFLPLILNGALFAAASFISARQPAATHTGLISHPRFSTITLAAGIAMILILTLMTLTRLLDRPLFLALRPWLLGLAAALILLAHLALHRFAILLAPIAAAAIILGYDQGRLPPAMVFEQFIPVLIFGPLVFLRAPVAPKMLRAAVLTVPCLFLILEFAHAHQARQIGFDPGPIAQNAQRPAGFPQWLTPPYAAVEIDYFAVPPDFHQLTFNVPDPYPAEKTLAGLDRKFQAAGYRKIPYSLRTPFKPASPITGWTEFRDTRQSPTRLVRQWSANWIGDGDDIVAVFLEYRRDWNKPDATNPLHVTVNHTTPDPTTRDLIRQYRHHLADNSTP